MTKTYELPNDKTIMADVDEKHHTATVSVYVLDDLVKEANKEDVLDKISTEIGQLPSYVAKFAGGDFAIHIDKEKVLQIIDKYKGESEGSNADSN